MQIDASGVSPTELAVYKTEFEDIFRSALGEDLVLDSETPQGQLIGVLAVALAEIDEVAVAVANGLSLYQAIGLQQDALGSLLSIDRIRRERSTVTVTISGTSGTVIDAGSLARTAAGDQFALDIQIVIPSGGSISAGMRSVEYGPIPAAAAALTEIVTVVSGWTGVTNAAAATPGRNAETNFEYRNRYPVELAVNARDGLEAIRARTRAVEGVSRVLAVENSDTSAVTIQGIDIDAGSILVVAEGGTDANVAAAIFAAKPAGIPTVGDMDVDVPHARGQITTVSFRRAVSEAIKVEASIDVLAGFPAGGITLMKERCAAWIDGTFEALPGQFDLGGLDIGDDLDTNRILTPLQSVPGHKITSYDVLLVNGDPLPASLQLDKRYTLDADNVAITVNP